MPRRTDTIFQRLKIRAAAFLIAAVIKLLGLTWRWEYHYDSSEARAWEDHGPLIFGFWHNQQLMAIWPWKGSRPGRMGRRLQVLISEHFDGRIIAAAVGRFGIDSVAGSSTRGGRRALVRLLQLLRRGDSVAITPDGPRGPLYRVKPGIVALAQRSGVPVLPVGFAADRCWRLKSWDRLIVPRPWARVTVGVGTPVSIPQHLNAGDFEAWQRRLSDALTALSHSAGGVGSDSGRFPAQGGCARSYA